jgi:pimeloyl-ACP methyl ester carboxylesterase
VAEVELREADAPAAEGARASEGARARMLAGVPASERRQRLGGASTAVLEAGSGPPLVLLQGGIECGGAYWAPVTGPLAEDHRVVAPDLPGLGESEPFARLDADSFADWLTALVEQTCAEPPTLVAHSLDGSLAARFASRHGSLLRRLMIYGAPGIGRYRMPLGLRVVAMRFALRPSERNAERFDRWAFFDYDAFRRAESQWLGAFASYTRSRATVPHVKRTMRRLIREGTRRIPDAELARIEIPTALLWGRHDRFVPIALAESASARHGWPLHVVEDAGHVPHIERPEAFLRALAEAGAP